MARSLWPGAAAAARLRARSYSSPTLAGGGAAGDTIFALSSGAGRAAIAVVRVSGPRAAAALAALVAPSSKPLPPGALRRRTLVDPADGSVVDSCMAVHLPGPATATGEDTVELHTHGSRAVVAKLFDVLRGLGCRPAAAGEFTRRAFTNGKLDLTTVEALGDLLNADTDAQRRLALRAMRGDVAALYEGWRSALIDVAAHVEAAIDFVDDVDAYEAGGADGVLGAVRARADSVVAAMERHLATGRACELIRSGLQVALFGPPNAGKSSLLNLLVRRPAAIVSAVPGTTRDVLEVTLELGGLPVLLADTAGLRHEADAADDVEREGMRRTVDRVAASHVRVCVVDLHTLVPPPDAGGGGGAPAAPSFARAARAAEFAAALSDPAATIVVLNKADADVAGCRVDAAEAALRAALPAHSTVLRVSCRHDLGVDALLVELQRRAEALVGGLMPGGGSGAEGDEPLLARSRHRQHLERCTAGLRAFLDGGKPLDLAAEELRHAIRELGCVTGRVDVEDVLDSLFASFCIGK